MAKNNNLTDYLVDVADAIRKKKGTTELINPQDFASEIVSIESGDTGNSIRVPYLRRNGNGYIDTGVKGANSNLKITIQYSFNAFPPTYWSLVHAYVNENTNATRILFNKNITVLANVNSLASNSVTQSVTLYEGVIYTTQVYSNSSNVYLVHNSIMNVKTRTTGADLGDATILLFKTSSDEVDINIYSLKIEDGDTVIRDFVPHYKDGEFGLYDLVERKFYSNAGEGKFTGELEYVDSEPCGGNSYTGHADAEGLRAIGWTDEDIAYYQENGVDWNEEDDHLHLVPDDNKALYGVLTPYNIGTYKDKIVYLPKISVTGLESLVNKFKDCYNLIAVPHLDTSLATNVQGIFMSCYRLRSVHPLDFSNATNLRYAFYQCYKLKKVDIKITNKCVEFREVFYQCYSLEALSPIDISSAESLYNTFGWCTSLRNLSIVTSNVTSDWGFTFGYCTNLVRIDRLNLANATSVNNIFVACSTIEDVELINLSQSIDMQSYLITKTSLLNAINNSITTASITIKLRPIMYDTYINDPEVLEALANHPNITLAK